MKRMIKYFVTIYFLALIPFNMFSQSNWVELINGYDFSGWEIKQGKAPFEIIEGNIVKATTILNSPSTYMGTIENYDDFILEYEIFATP